MEDIFYNEITTEAHYYQHTGTGLKTKYYITKVPHKDSKGQRILLKKGIADDASIPYVSETPSSFVKRNPGITFLTNASTGAEFNPSKPNQKIGIHVKDGVLLAIGAVTKERATLFEKADGTLTFLLHSEILSINTSMASAAVKKYLTDYVINNKIRNSWTSFIPLIVDGKSYPYFDHLTDERIAGASPRQVIAQTKDKSLIFLSCEGRLEDSVGLTFAEIIEILKGYNVSFAYNLDGGGSAQSIFRHIPLITPLDEKNQTERRVCDYIYFKKDTSNLSFPKELDVLGEVALDAHSAKAIALKLNKSPVWENMLLEDNWESFNSSRILRVTQYHSRVDISGAVKFTGESVEADVTATTNQITQLPAEYKPKRTMIFPCSIINNRVVKLIHVVVYSDGRVCTYGANMNNNESIDIQINFPLY